MMGPVVKLGMSFNLTFYSVYIPIKPFRLQEVSLNATCSEGRTVNCLSDLHPSKFCLEQEDVSALFLFKCALVYSINEFQANQNGLKFNGTVEILFCVNGANLLALNKQSL
jgi:hypothetical protein